MIDTDKYTGHTEGPWEYNTDDDGWTLATIHERDDPDRDEFIVLITKPNGDTNLTMNPDLRLIADAPLILEAYKELRMMEKFYMNQWHHALRLMKDAVREAINTRWSHKCPTCDELDIWFEDFVTEEDVKQFIIDRQNPKSIYYVGDEE